MPSASSEPGRITANLHRMDRRDRVTILLALAVAAFMGMGAYLNLSAAPFMIEDFRKWGYPGGFNYVTGALELPALILLLLHRYRIFGVLLALSVLSGAFITLIVHGEFQHALAPAIALILALTLALRLLRHRKNGRVGVEKNAPD